MSSLAHLDRNVPLLTQKAALASFIRRYRNAHEEPSDREFRFLDTDVLTRVVSVSNRIQLILNNQQYYTQPIVMCITANPLTVLFGKLVPPANMDHGQLYDTANFNVNSAQAYTLDTQNNLHNKMVYNFSVTIEYHVNHLGIKMPTGRAFDQVVAICEYHSPEYLNNVVLFKLVPPRAVRALFN